MSGGLLEKAQSQDEEVVAAVEDVEETSGGGLLERATSGEGRDNQNLVKGQGLGFVAIIIMFQNNILKCNFASIIIIFHV